jgi:cobalamin biosynthesis Co2+ chelatase CbiK
MNKELTKKLELAKNKFLMMEELEKAIELHNQSRDILNKLLDKKLKEHSQNYWIRKGILTSQITRLAHQRDRMHIETIIKALQKMI